MRFPSTFIATFLAAPAVLALSNVAGVRLRKRSVEFDFINATVTVPHISCQNAAIVFVGIALDEPSTCGSAFEVGVALRCNTSSADGKPFYTAYTLTHPNEAEFYPSPPINEGDTINVVITWGADGISGISGWIYFGMDTNGFNMYPDEGAQLCQDSVTWLVEAEGSDKDPVPIPQFDPITFSDLVAQDDAGNMYKPTDGEELDMTTVDGTYWVTTSASEDSITITWQDASFSGTS